MRMFTRWIAIWIVFRVARFPSNNWKSIGMGMFHCVATPTYRLVHDRDFRSATSTLFRCLKYGAVPLSDSIELLIAAGTEA